jgi:hypothetical protein
MLLTPRYALYSATFAGLLLLSACGKKESAPASPPATASTAAAAASTAVAAPAATPAPGSTAPTMPATAATTATAAIPQAAAPVSSPLTVAKLTLGSAVNAEHEVTHASSRFASNDKTIYASVATDGHSDGAKLNAKWSYLEGQGQLVSNITQSIATDGPAVTTFKVQNPDLWPEGKYKVEISLDGKPVTSQDFEVAKR